MKKENLLIGNWLSGLLYVGIFTRQKWWPVANGDCKQQPISSVSLLEALMVMRQCYLASARARYKGNDPVKYQQVRHKN